MGNIKREGVREIGEACELREIKIFNSKLLDKSGEIFKLWIFLFLSSACANTFYLIYGVKESFDAILGAPSFTKYVILFLSFNLTTFLILVAVRNFQLLRVVEVFLRNVKKDLINPQKMEELKIMKKYLLTISILELLFPIPYIVPVLQVIFKILYFRKFKEFRGEKGEFDSIINGLLD